MPVDLLGLPVAAQQTAQDPHAAHPAQLLRHASVGRTLSLTCGGHVGLNQRSRPSEASPERWSQLTDSHVSSFAARQRVLAATRPRVDSNRLADDETILHQFADLLA